MKRRMTILLACLLALLTPLLAAAEQVTLTYSYGSEARDKHMLDVANTVEYGGKTYTFDQGGFEFKGAFSMYGGNIRTVLECEVPRVQMAIHEADEGLLLGQVTIDPPSPMTLHVFSGDRVSGQYTLTDTQTADSYVSDIYAARDEAGNLRLVDKVFLYSCVQDGKEVNYAASLYISYEGVAASPAEGAPANAAANTAAAAPAPANPAGELATYVSMVRILEEERANLCAQLAEKDAEIARLTGEVTGLTEQNTALTDEKTKLTGQVAEKDTEIARLTGEVTSLTEQNAPLKEENTKLTAQVAEKDAEIARLTGEVDRLAQQTAELSAANDSLQSQVSNAISADEADSLQARIVELEAANAALQVEAQLAADLNDRIVQLEKEVIALRAGDASLSAVTAPPTPEPTSTPELTAVPTAAPTAEPTPAPTVPPTPEPTAAPTAVPAPAETVITFQERSWGSGADDIAQWLLDAGIVTNQYSLLSGGHAWLQPCYYAYVYLAGDGSVPAQNSYMTATKMLWANQFLSADFRVAGYEVENLYFAFAAQGDETKLIGVSVDFKCPEGEEAAFAEVQQKLRDTYGAGNADDDTCYLRFGQNNTALHLFRRPYDGLILTYGDTTAMATLESMTK